MATSGYSDAWVSQWDTLRFNWWQTGQSIPNNETYISWNLQLISGKYGAIYSSPARAWSVNVNGASYSGTASVGIGNNTTNTLASGSTTISHNNDGTKWFAYSFSQAFEITFSGSWIGTVSGSGSETLDSIPRYATITGAPDFNDEDTNLTIYFDNPGNFDLKLKMEAGGDNELILRDRVTKTSPYTFVLTEDEKKLLRQKCTGDYLSVRFTVVTYLNGVETNWSWTDKTMTLVNYNPTLNPTVVDVGAYSTAFTGDPNKIILNFNVVEIKFNAVAQKEASIVSMNATCGNTSIYADGSMGYVNSGTFVFSVTDSRGHTATKTITKETINYIPLSCNASYEAELVEETTANITLNIGGNYFNGSFGARSNALTLEYRYKVNNGSYPTDDNGNDVWTTITNPTLSDGKYSAQKTLNGVNYQDTYTFQVRAADVINNGNGAKYSELVVKILPVFDWSENDFNFNVPVRAPLISGYSGTPLPDGNWSDKNYWMALDNGVYFYNFEYDGYTVGSADSMPYNWGFVEKIGTDSNFSAIFYAQPNGLIYRLSGNFNQFHGWHALALESYPVTSIFITYSHDSPASIFGGTWTRIENRFLWGCDGNGGIGDTGGEYSHTLTIDEMPSHNHYGFATDVNTTIHDTNTDRYPYGTWTNDYNSVYTGSTGGNQPHNNLPPYIMVSIWRRTA